MNCIIFLGNTSICVTCTKHLRHALLAVESKLMVAILVRFFSVTLTGILFTFSL